MLITLDQEYEIKSLCEGRGTKKKELPRLKAMLVMPTNFKFQLSKP